MSVVLGGASVCMGMGMGRRDGVVGIACAQGRKHHRFVVASTALEILPYMFALSLLCSPSWLVCWSYCSLDDIEYVHISYNASYYLSPHSPNVQHEPSDHLPAST